MRNKQGQSIPNAVLQSGENKFSWLQDMKSLSIGELIELYAYSEAIVETIREPLVILDSNLRIKTVNRSFLDTFKTTKKATYGKYIYIILIVVNGIFLHYENSLRTFSQKILISMILK